MIENIHLFLIGIITILKPRWWCSCQPGSHSRASMQKIIDCRLSKVDGFFPLLIRLQVRRFRYRPARRCCVIIRDKFLFFSYYLTRLLCFNVHLYYPFKLRLSGCKAFEVTEKFYFACI